MAVTAARGLGRLSLEDALALTELFARTGDSRFETAAVNLLARLADERRPSLGGIRIAVEALAEPPVRREPEWLGPPDNVLPHTFPLWLAIARTERVAVQLHSGRAYSSGFEFGLTLRRREVRRGLEGDPIHSWHRVRETGVIPEETPRLGVEFADGQSATVFDGYRFFATEERLSGPVLIQRGGSGGMRTWELNLSVWALPPPRPLAFARRMAERRRRADAAGDRRRGRA